MTARLRVLGAFVALVLGAALLPASAAAQTVDPLPPCSYADVLTARSGYDQSLQTFLDTYYMVPDTYAPADLVLTSDAGVTGGGKVRSFVIADLRALAAAAKAGSKPVAVTSAYRSYTRQGELFNADVIKLGYDAALLHTARPGHSEHQLGTTIDFKSRKTGDVSPGGDWALSKAGKWMKNNAWKYGWIMSYPKDKTAVTCYSYEPWHYRYVGREAAAAINASGLTLREWLWQQGYALPATLRR